MKPTLKHNPRDRMIQRKQKWWVKPTRFQASWQLAGLPLSLRVDKVEKHCCPQATESPQVLSLRPESRRRE